MGWMKAHVFVAVVLVGLAVLGREAIADTITFTSPVVQTGGAIVGGEYFQEAGFHVEAWNIISAAAPTGTTFNAVANNSTPFDGDRLFIGHHRNLNSAVGIVIERIGGGAFDLLSLDLFAEPPGEPPPDVIYIATAPLPGAPLGAALGWTAFAVTVPVGGVTVSTPGFAGVSRVWIGLTGVESTTMFIDNITVADPIPEPSTLALLGGLD